MKKFIFILILAFIGNFAVAQDHAYVDTKFILEQIPQYKEAQKKLDDLSEKWQQEVEAKYAEIEKKWKAYQEEEILLPEDLKKQRQEEIIQLEREAKKFQREKFGPDGELYQKRQELIKPIQDKIYKAIKEVAKDKYDFVFDKASQSNILYTNPKYDISDKVLKEMGY